MSTAEHHHRVDYIEFQAVDLEATKKFYNEIFGWKFEDYGPTYTSFNDGRLTGGFAKADKITPNGVLIVIYSTALETVLGKIQAAGAKITKDIFSFPGGRRFHFHDPNGNELAVWSDK